MSKKKSDQPAESPEQKELEQRVDAMMSVEASRAKSSAVSDPAPNDDEAKDESTSASAEPQTTAPLLPTKLLKAIGADKKVKADPTDDQPADIALRIGDSDSKQTVRIELKHKTETQPRPDDDKSAEPPKAAARTVSDKDPLGDSETDSAVEDIVAHEADTQLAVEDAVTRRRAAEAAAGNRRNLLAVVFSSPWTWLLIIGTAGVVFAWFH